MKTYEEYKVSGVKWLGKVPKTLGKYAVSKIL